MILSKNLKKQGYDLLLGETRQHKIGQLWKKTLTDKIALHAKSAGDIFTPQFTHAPEISKVMIAEMLSENSLEIGTGKALVKGLDQLLGSVALSFSANKQISLSYDDAEMMEIPTASIEEFFYSATVKSQVPSLIEAMNKNQLVFISGIIVAKGLNIHIKKGTGTQLELPESLTKVEVTIANQNSNELVLTTKTPDFIPLAVKAHRLDFDKGRFSKASLLTDFGNRFK